MNRQRQLHCEHQHHSHWSKVTPALYFLRPPVLGSKSLCIGGKEKSMVPAVPSWGFNPSPIHSTTRESGVSDIRIDHLECILLSRLLVDDRLHRAETALAKKLPAPAWHILPECIAHEIDAQWADWEISLLPESLHMHLLWETKKINQAYASWRNRVMCSVKRVRRLMPGRTHITDANPDMNG